LVDNYKMKLALVQPGYERPSSAASFLSEYASFPRDIQELKTLIKSQIKDRKKSSTVAQIEDIYFEDSEHDWVALSEDEDLVEADRYRQMKGMQALTIYAKV
jgi:hypothetical protein